MFKYQVYSNKVWGQGDLSDIWEVAQEHETLSLISDTTFPNPAPQVWPW